MALSLPPAAGPAAVTALAERLLGPGVATAPGVVHTTSVAAAPPGAPLATLRLGPSTPTCDYDTFVLNLARARADAIVTTGRILRQEPRLSLALQGRGFDPGRLGDWRRRVLGRERPPYAIVLTSGRGLDLAHPVFAGGARPVVLTSSAAASALAEPAAQRGVRVVGIEALELRVAIAWARDVLGARHVSVEAGPSTTRALYAGPAVVDSLWLSVFEGAAPPWTLGAALPPLASLCARLARDSGAVGVETPGGRWWFRSLSRDRSIRGCRRP